MARPVYTLDFETDPFEYGEYPVPFAAGLYDGDNYTEFWGPECVVKMMAYLACQRPGLVYAHNGGRFDFFYLLKWLAGNSMRVINNRIVQAHIPCLLGGQMELRDSYAIMPFALGNYKGRTQKIDIELWKLKREHREQHKAEILRYQEYDCRTLHELVSGFIEEFGPKLTIGGTAMGILKEMHPFATLDQYQDFEIRSRYFYGGRVEAFRKGVLPGAWKVYDVNSMYPYVMAHREHPIGPPSCIGTDITEDTYFVTVEGRNHGAFPMRMKGGGIQFDVPSGVFHVTIHEWNMARKYNLFEPKRILSTYEFIDTGNMYDYVSKYAAQKIEAKRMGNALRELFAKFLLNSGYGKYAQNPEKYVEQMITDDKTDLHYQGWIASQVRWTTEDERYIVWEKKAEDVSRYNVATGASITGAARSILMEAIATAVNPIYCDTDSLICEELPGVTIDDAELGAWKLEGEADRAAIGGKKLYALFDSDGERIEDADRKIKKKDAGMRVKIYDGLGMKVKQANKGVKLTPEEIVRVCRGETITHYREAPVFKLDGSWESISRRVRMT